jgi:hypothetical protein
MEDRMRNDLMWDDTENQIKAELGSQERLLWTGRPRSGILFRPADALLIPFSLLWGGFAIFWEATVITQRAPFFFKLWGVPFVLVGLYLIVGRFFADARQRAKTYYGITSERVIIISGLFRRSVKSLNIETLSDITLTEKSDGSGSITLGPTHPMLGWARRSKLARHTAVLAPCTRFDRRRAQRLRDNPHRTT